MIRPQTIADIPTPALIVDIVAMDRNIQRMACFFREGPCTLRPHFKAHKTPEVARRQLAAGSCVGLTCATVSEAEIAAAVCDDLRSQRLYSGGTGERRAKRRHRRGHLRSSPLLRSTV
jgi:D-serine deaminase-like pyridoxal phosphate-dependent protein